MEITKMTALELGRAIRAGEISVTEATRLQLDRIAREDAAYHAYITVLEEDAMKQARQVEKKLAAGEFADSPLAGVPMAIKDNICTGGVPTTCASRILEGFRPPYDAEVVIRLKASGAVVLGKLNMDEFAMGSTTETSYFGPTRNPRSPEHVPGGSSGGAAAAVAADEAFYTLGSDTGGSIRQPSSFCGVVGMKPTYGVVSRYGLIAYGSSLDQIGPITKDVSDCAAVLEMIAGYDEKDSTSMKQADYRYTEGLTDDVKGMRIGIPRSYFGDGLDPEVAAAVRNAAKELENAGAVVEEFDLNMLRYAIPAYYVIASAEASSNLSRFDGVKYGYRTPEYEGLQDVYKKTRTEGFGPEVRRRMMIGAFVLSSGYYDAYYNKALKVKNLILQDFVRAFERYDLILGPAAPTTAPKLGESLDDPLKMYLGDIYTVSVNLAGLPGIVVPCGTDHAGLPVGLQLIGPHFSEKKLLRVAYTYEQCRRKSGKGGTQA